MQPSPPPENQPGQPGQPSNGLGLASMIVGIVSIPLICCFSIGTLGGIAAVVLGFLGKAKADRGEATNRGQALAGIICGFVAVGLGLLLFIFGIVLGTFDFDSWANLDT